LEVTISARYYIYIIHYEGWLKTYFSVKDGIIRDVKARAFIEWLIRIKTIESYNEG